MKHTVLFIFAVLVTACAVAQSNDFHLNQEYGMSPTGTIDLSSSDAKVFITGSNRPTAHVKIDRTIDTRGISLADRVFKVEVANEDGDLHIKEVKYGWNFSVAAVHSEQYRIEIEVPEGVSLSIRGDDGHYVIKNVHGGIQLSADDATVTLNGCKGDRFRFRMDDGDVRMDEGRGSLDIAGDDLNATIHNAAFSSVMADIDDGLLLLETSLDDKGSYSFHSEDGTLALTVTKGGGEFMVRHDDTHVVTEGDFKTLEKSEHMRRVVLADGSAQVNIRADDGRVKLLQPSR